MSLRKNNIVFGVIISLTAFFILIFQSETKNLSYKSKNNTKALPDISQESSIIAQLIWNNVLQGIPIEERDIGIPAFIEGMLKTANYPAADFEVYFGNIKEGTEYFHLHKLLKDNSELAEKVPIVNFPYEKYHKLLKELAFFTGFKTWAHFKDDEHAILEEVISGINSIKDQSQSSTLHSLSRKDIDELHKNIYQKKNRREIQEAENYFRKISKMPGVEVLKENRLYRKRFNLVSSKKIERDSKLYICYRMESLYGHVIYDSKGPELVELDRAMHGLKEGLIGMQEGEKCTLFIHPEWTDLDLFSPPYFQSFIVMPIEVVDVLTP